jgi:hypothetical protein
MLSGEEAFAEVAADDLFGIADGGEIGAGVPLEEEMEVSRELRKQGGGRIREIRNEEGCDCRL